MSLWDKNLTPDGPKSKIVQKKDNTFFQFTHPQKKNNTSRILLFVLFVFNNYATQFIMLMVNNVHIPDTDDFVLSDIN